MYVIFTTSCDKYHSCLLFFSIVYSNFKEKHDIPLTILSDLRNLANYRDSANRVLVWSGSDKFLKFLRSDKFLGRLLLDCGIHEI